MKTIICLLLWVNSFSQTDKELMPYVQNFVECNKGSQNYFSGVSRIVKTIRQGNLKVPYEVQLKALKNGKHYFIIVVNYRCRNKQIAINEALTEVVGYTVESQLRID